MLVYGLIHLWLKANASALSNIDQQEYGRITVIRVPVAQLTDSDAEKHPLLEIPASEIKGVLNHTFEMDYIDAESLPVDKVSEVLKKE